MIEIWPIENLQVRIALVPRAAWALRTSDPVWTAHCRPSCKKADYYDSWRSYWRFNRALVLLWWSFEICLLYTCHGRHQSYQLPRHISQPMKGGSNKNGYNVRILNVRFLRYFYFFTLLPLKGLMEPTHIRHNLYNVEQLYYN